MGAMSIIQKEKEKFFRWQNRIKDFKLMLTKELNFTKVDTPDLQTIEKYKFWKVEFIKYIVVDFISGSHNIIIRCYEMEKLEFEFHFNLYKGSFSDYQNLKTIFKTLILY